MYGMSNKEEHKSYTYSVSETIRTFSIYCQWTILSCSLSNVDWFWSCGVSESTNEWFRSPHPSDANVGAAQLDPLMYGTSSNALGGKTDGCRLYTLTQANKWFQFQSSRKLMIAGAHARTLLPDVASPPSGNRSFTSGRFSHIKNDAIRECRTWRQGDWLCRYSIRWSSMDGHRPWVIIGTEVACGEFVGLRFLWPRQKRYWCVIQFQVLLNKNNVVSPTSRKILISQGGMDILFYLQEKRTNLL